MDLKSFFSDTKWVLMGGSADRMAKLAALLRSRLPAPSTQGGFVPTGPISKTERFTMYKVGPVVCCSHGMGMPSMSILLHEMAKLMAYSEAEDVTFVRIGTSGGLGCPPGTVIVSQGSVNGLCEPEYSLPVLGELRTRPTGVFDENLCDDLIKSAQKQSIHAMKGLTMGTDCFYEGQNRLDGAFCDYTDKDKMDFLKKIHSKGVRNIEMESSYFGYFCHRSGIRGATVCCTLLDRLQGDQVTSTPAQLGSFADNAMAVVVGHIADTL